MCFFCILDYNINLKKLLILHITSILRLEITIKVNYCLNGLCFTLHNQGVKFSISLGARRYLSANQERWRKKTYGKAGGKWEKGLRDRLSRGSFSLTTRWCSVSVSISVSLSDPSKSFSNSTLLSSTIITGFWAARRQSITRAK